MGILKVKDWAKSKPGVRQFRPLLITTTNYKVLSVQRLSDNTTFTLDQCICANTQKEISVFITEFLPDEIRVRITGKAKGKTWLHSKDLIVEINKIGSCAPLIIDDLAIKIAYE